MNANALRIHSLVPRSRVAGPGLRCLIHTQGCDLGCPGCFNPGTHDPNGGELKSVDDLLRTIGGLADIEGITISGGEPLQQAMGLAALAEGAQRAGLSVVLYSGYTREEIEASADGRRVLRAADVLIDGRYDATLPCSDGYRGSANQRLHFISHRYGQEDFPVQQGAFEADIAPDGSVTVRGFPDPKLQQALNRLLGPNGAPVGSPSKKKDNV